MSAKLAVGTIRVEQPRIVVADQMLLHRPAGASAANRVARHAERLDEVLFHHHHRLGRHHVVRMGAEHVQRRPRQRVALRDRVIPELAFLEVAAIAVQTANRPALVYPAATPPPKV